MADVMGRCSQLPRASRFPLRMVDVISSGNKLLLASRFLPNIMVDVLNLRFPVNMVDVRFPLNMVEVMGSLGRLLLASRFLSSRSKLLWASHPNMVAVPLSMVDVMGRARELLWASRFLNIKLPLASRLTFNMVDALSLRFPVNMVDVLSCRSKLLLARVRAAPSGHSCPLQADPPNMGIPSQTQPEFSKSNGKVVTYDVEKLEDAQ
ncbi:unnamed protein product, partial [Cladocopium goreaui]